jgi:hypothetical protein
MRPLPKGFPIKLDENIAASKKTELLKRNLGNERMQRRSWGLTGGVAVKA